MTCDRGLCLRAVTVAIPEVGEWCSVHVFEALGSWPQRRFREIETRNKDSRRFLPPKVAA